jgi:ribonuclease P/MRP protein subunit RPP1
MFYDLNIEYDKDDTNGLSELLATSIKYGYGCVALNWTTKVLSKDDTNVIELVNLENEIEQSLGRSKGSRMKPELAKEARVRLEASGKKFLQLKRVTIDMTEDGQAPALSSNNPLLAGFDLVAVRPSTEKLLLTAVQSPEIDIVSFDASKKLNFRIRTSIARQAVDNGIMFEICFGEALKDPLSRRNAISNARRIVDATKGKNIIISSGASDPLLLRGPYDFINLAHLFGLEAAAARKCMSQNGRAIFLHALTRKTSRGVLDLQTIASLDEHMKWTVPEQALLEQALTFDGLDQSDHAMDIDEPVASSSNASEPPKKSSNKGKRKRDSTTATSQ